ncbi:hypothetical protein PRABACTJOHN_03171 [Parabacteroides johnsonii DSM 18315]|uniref:Uncharacterized protein n=1 Tax=Parabacteroides johnsonii DSM 18315 TaxID=537006 RepID=B7BDP6_9BACT|nr:hypothetical protein PRABACTJOHN_03171 [Parabacteroides johnsonii DSM 18315]
MVLILIVFYSTKIGKTKVHALKQKFHPRKQKFQGKQLFETLVSNFFHTETFIP